MGDKDCQKWCPVFRGLHEVDIKKVHSISETHFSTTHQHKYIADENRPRVLNRSLYALLLNATEVIGDVAENNMYTDRYQWQRDMFGHSFSISRTTCPDSESGTVVSVIRHWMRSHEEAQVMLASVLVVIGLWWLVRAVLTLLINLVCPLLVVILAVVCVPQLRAPLLGQNYPLLANLLRNILLKMAENIKT